MDPDSSKAPWPLAGLSARATRAMGPPEDGSKPARQGGKLAHIHPAWWTLGTALSNPKRSRKIRPVLLPPPPQDCGEGQSVGLCDELKAFFKIEMEFT